jgi:hypothetical protein
MSGELDLRSDPLARREEARLNALYAIEHDPVRRHERLLDLRLFAAVLLAPRVDIAEALLLGAAVPAKRLDRRLVSALELAGDVVLDEELAMRVNARGPLEETA